MFGVSAGDGGIVLGQSDCLRACIPSGLLGLVVQVEFELSYLSEIF